jgi:hypothetical protein
MEMPRQKLCSSAVTKRDASQNTAEFLLQNGDAKAKKF